MGFPRQEEEEEEAEEKKNLNKSNSFSASPKRAEKPTRDFMSVCKTEHKAFPPSHPFGIFVQLDSYKHFA